MILRPIICVVPKPASALPPLHILPSTLRRFWQLLPRSSCDVLSIEGQRTYVRLLAIQFLAFSKEGCDEGGRGPRSRDQKRICQSLELYSPANSLNKGLQLAQLRNGMSYSISSIILLKTLGQQEFSF